MQNYNFILNRRFLCRHSSGFLCAFNLYLGLYLDKLGYISIRLFAFFARMKSEHKRLFVYLLLDYRNWPVKFQSVAKSHREYNNNCKFNCAQPRTRRRRNVTRNRYDLITRAIHPLSPGDDESSLARGSRGKPSILCPMRNRFLLRERARRDSTDAECFLTRHFNRKWPGRKGVGRGLRALGTAPFFSAQPSSPPRRDS